MRWTLLVVGLVGMILALVPGCETSGDAHPDGNAGGAPHPVQGEWVLASIRGEAVDLDAVPRAPTMRVDANGEIGGFGGVNSWGSTLDVSGMAEGRFDAAPPHTTLMAGPRDAMELERRYMEAVRATDRFEVGADGALRLLGADGEELLRFSRSG